MVAILILSFSQPNLNFLSEYLQLNDFLQCAEFVCFYLFECEESLCSPSGQPNYADFSLAQAIPQSILLNPYLPFLLIRVVIGVYDKVVLPYDIFLLHVVLEDLFQVDMQTHKLSERLLAYQSLSLHIDLSDGFARQALRLNYTLPLADAELHQCQS